MPNMAYFIMISVILDSKLLMKMPWTRYVYLHINYLKAKKYILICLSSFTSPFRVMIKIYNYYKILYSNKKEIE